MIAKHKIFFPLLLLLISLVGCKVDSMNPISSLDDAQPDVALYGVWRYQAKGELTYVHIGPEFSLSISNAAAAANKRIKIILIDHKPNGITEEAHVAHGSRVGRQRYLNVVQVEEGKPVGFVFVQYTLIDKNTLRFSAINNEALKTAIRAGQIKGTIHGEGLASETAITAESVEIESFLKQEGAKLFAKPVVLKRVQDR